MCTALNLAITERTGGGKGGSKKSGVCVWGGPPGFIIKVVPAGAASRVSLQRGVLSRGGFKARHHDGNGVQSLGKHAALGEVSLLFLAPARPDGTRGTGVRCSGVQAGIRTGKINNPPTPIIILLQHDTKA